MTDPHLRVYRDRSEIIHPDGTSETFVEGSMSPDAQKRYKKIQQAFASGFLEKQILRCRDTSNPLAFNDLSNDHLSTLDRLVNAVTSEVGRALMALVIMQLSVKTIEPEQNIRLHKSGKSTKDFSWRDGISMRTLDKSYVTPMLRKYDLVKLNADGVMMTRSLAENYPYSLFYKAKIRGARNEWLSLVEAIELGQIHTEQALLYLISQLLNQANAFKSLADETLVILDRVLDANSYNIKGFVTAIIFEHIDNSGYAARAMEIAMHALMQSIQELGGLSPQELKPLSQMRSANKKHGNIGDIELLENGQIVEAWDAKFGKTYLRDEIEELADKLNIHPSIAKVGFVTSQTPQHLEELEPRIREIEELFDVTLRILAFTDWIDEQFSQVSPNPSITTSDAIAVGWLRAFTESIAQKRRELAPIDEPCYKWLEVLKSILSSRL